MTNNTFTQIDVTDIVGPTVTVEESENVQQYFGRLIDALFNRPGEIKMNSVKFTKTAIRQMYKRAYPKAKV